MDHIKQVELKKDAYYFPHYSNARNDRKIQHIRRVFGSQGYGIYFMLLEILREQTNFKYPLNGLDDLAFDLREPKEIILSIINDFDLFTVDKTNNFFSPKLIFYLQPYLEKSERARKAAEIRWSNANAYANALPPQSKSSAKGDASKGEESKLKKTKVEISIDFYQNQIESLNGEKYSKEYQMIYDYISGKNDLERPLNEVFQFPDQLTYKQFEKLFDKSKKKEFSFKETLMTITNKKDYWDKKTSLYLTLNGWINRSKDK